MKSGIYVIHTPENFIYVGQSIDLDRREKDYVNKSSRIKGQPKIYGSIDKFGWKGHTFTVLEHCEIGMLNERERYWQDEFECTNPLFGLNCMLQNANTKRRKFSDEYKKELSEKTKGENNPFYGKTHSEETKQKLRENIGVGENHRYYGVTGEEHPAFGYKFTEEQREKVSRGLKGKPKSKDHIEKVRVANTGKKRSEEIKNKMKGRVVSDETKQKLREINLGKKHTEETKKKIGDRFRGIQLSDEHKEKISKSKKGKKQSEEHRKNWRKSIKENEQKIIRITDGKIWNSPKECIDELKISLSTYYRNIDKENNKYKIKKLSCI